MPKSILIDINVILDVLIKRSGYKASVAVIALTENDNFGLWISAHSLTTLAYLLEKDGQPRVVVLKTINWALEAFETVPISADLLKAAAASKMQDFEDAVMEQAALACKASVIVTRNIRDYKLSSVAALTPEQFLQS
jgi:predicted nucleic acid-binding protein